MYDTPRGGFFLPVQILIRLRDTRKTLKQGASVNRGNIKFAARERRDASFKLLRP